MIRLSRKELTYLLRLVRQRIADITVGIARRILRRDTAIEVRLLINIRNKLWKEKLDEQKTETPDKQPSKRQHPRDAE